MKSLKILLAATCILGSFYAAAQQGREAPNGPPPEAIEACEGKSEGETVSFETRRGDTLTGVCQYIEEQLVAVPEHHRGE